VHLGACIGVCRTVHEIVENGFVFPATAGAYR
jgi:hypothetical protein